MDLEPCLVHEPEVGKLRQRTGNEKGHLLAHQRGGVRVEEAAVQELPPFPGELAGGDGEHDRVSLPQGAVVEVDEPVLARVRAAILRAATQAALAPSPDLQIVEVVQLHRLREGSGKAIHHGLEVALSRKRVAENDDPQPIDGDRSRGRGQGKLPAGCDQGCVEPRRWSVAADRLEQILGETLKPRPLGRLHLSKKTGIPSVPAALQDLPITSTR